VLVTSGATEALGDCLFGLIEPGDEVVLIEPLYDSYLPIVRGQGASQAGAARAADLAPAARGTRRRSATAPSSSCSTRR
jgi:aspartate/methionine/tyrosine aminotransferase